MSQKSRKTNKIKNALETCEKILTELKVPFVLAAIDRDAKIKGGGNIHMSDGMGADDFIYIIDLKYNDKKQLLGLAAWVSAVIKETNKPTENKPTK